MTRRCIQVGGVGVELTIGEAKSNYIWSEVDRVFDGFLAEGGNIDYRLVLHSFGDRGPGDPVRMPARREMMRMKKALERRFPFTGLPRWDTTARGKNRRASVLRKGAFGRLSLRAIEDGRASLVITPSFLLAVDHEERSADALLFDREGDGPYDAALAVQALYGVVLPEYGGMILHAAAIDAGDRGVLLVGGADVGKTTVSSRVPKDRLLADDGAVCICRDGRVSLVPSPFTQTPVDNTRARTVGLASLMFLIQDEADYAETHPPGEAMVSLLSNHIHFFRFMSPQNARLSFHIIERIINTATIERLFFSLDFDPTLFFTEKEYVR
ncbi:MAG: hypothetical protein JW885_16800 [Deltaproteobacteria bacterium]|nr:hypothetical protein [Candidatus Zymogenaceae bacterium]